MRKRPHLFRGSLDNEPLPIRSKGERTKQPHDFSYILHGNGLYVNCNPIGKDESNARYNNTLIGNGLNENYSREVVTYNLQPGETVTYDIRVTMLAGSIPTVNHAFVIDATEEQKDAPLSSPELNNK